MLTQSTLLSAPLVVAVTGHRDLWPQDQDLLAEAFGNELIKLEEGQRTAEAELKKPGHNDVSQQCILLCALAEGADTLAAQIALNLGWRVIAPLPLPVKEYRRGFEGDALKEKEFDDLLTRCAHFFIGYAPGCNKKNTSLEADSAEFRTRQYAFVGEFLTRHCEFLIAFWDGEEARGFGGTGDVVRTQREGIPAHIMELRCDGTLLDEPEGGRVIQIWTKRKTGAELRDGKTHGDVDEDKPQEAETKGQTDDHIKARRAKALAFVEAAKVVTNPDTSDALPPEPTPPEEPYLACARNAFLRANTLASRFQEQMNQRFRRVLGAGLAFTLFISIALAWSNHWVPLVVSWGFLFLAWRIVIQEKKSPCASRFQDYRALAEAWRVTFFWRLVGIGDPLDISYLRFQRGELDWIRQALRTQDLLWRVENQGNHPQATAAGFHKTFDKWIQSQTVYFGGKVPQYREHLTSLRNWAWALLILGLCASALDTPAQMNLSGTRLSAIAWFSHFATAFASANMLTSPFVPAVLSLAHMRTWPVATETNTQDVGGPTKKLKQKAIELRLWFNRENLKWRLAAVGTGLLMVAAVAAQLVGWLSPNSSNGLLQVVATICFFLPAIIYAAAEFQALPDNVTRYDRMNKIFEHAQKMLEEIATKRDPNGKPMYQDAVSAQKNASPEESERTLLLDWSDQKVQEKARRIYRELGREALHENGEWLLIHRDRPLDIEA